MEQFPSASVIMSQENGIPEESQDELHEKQRKNKEKLKLILKKMVLWGMIIGSTLTSTKKEHEEGRALGFGQGIEPETTTASSLLGSKEENKTEAFYADKVVTPESIGLSLSESESTYLCNVFGEEYLNDLKIQWLNQSCYEKFERKGKESIKTAIENFDKIELPPELLEKICTQTYPKNWVSTEIDSIIFEDEREEMPADYGTGGYAVASAIRKNTGITTVIFHQDAGRMIEEINRTFSHESGHANSFEADNTLSVEERKQLLLKITKRYFSGENIYCSDYVESINNEDPQRENYRKISEYWAVICEEYFNNPQWFKENHTEDYKIVHEYVLKQDPSFNPVKAKLNRDNIINKFEEDRNIENFITFEKNLIKNYPPKIQQVLTGLLNKYVQKINKAADSKEINDIQWDYVRERSEIEESFEKSELVNSLSPAAKQAYKQLEHEYLEKLGILLEKKDGDGVIQLLNEDLKKDVETLGGRSNLNENNRSLLRSIIYDKMMEILENA